MRVLHVIANLAPRYGGPSKACVEMARAVSRLGHEVSIYTTNQDGPGELTVPTDRPVFDQGVEIRYFPIQPPRFWGTSLPAAGGLARAIRRSDVVHVHSLYLFHGLIAGHYCRKLAVPYLIRPHGTLDPYLHRRHRWRKFIAESLFENRNIRHASAMHFTTEEERRLAEPYIFQTRAIVVPLGLHLADYDAVASEGQLRAAYPHLKDRKIVLFLGRLNFKKGLDILARSFAMIAKKRSDLHLVIAGPDDDGMGQAVKSWLERDGISDRVTFTGMLTGAAKLAAFHEADIFVLPSYSENFGISVIEALACGLPVVISDQVNIWREVLAAGAGRVTPCDPALFAEAMLDMLDDPALRRRMGVHGKALIAERFQWDSIARDLESAYASVAAA